MLLIHTVEQESANFLFEGSESMLGFEDHMITVKTTQLCHQSANVATDYTQTNEHGCVSTKLYS